MTILLTLFQIFLVLLLAPLSLGLVRKFKAFFQGRVGASIWLPYVCFATLLKKEMTISPVISFVFRLSPFLVLGTTVLLVCVLPLVSTVTIFASLSNFMMVAGVLAMGSLYLVLGALDAGGGFGGIGATREMTVSALSEVVIITVFASFAVAGNNAQISEMLSLGGSAIFSHPFLILSLIGLTLVALAENARYPVDNPATHLELTMVHEANILEYSGPYLAMMEYAATVKLTIFSLLIANFVYPVVLVQFTLLGALGIVFLTIIKLVVVMFFLALLESLMAKMRFYRLQEYFSLAFLIAVLGFFLTILYP
ncbi:MAG: NADH-quinone oxidoreductase subunit H [Candidatus Peregrinibacteria bacterium]